MHATNQTEAQRYVGVAAGSEYRQRRTSPLVTKVLLGRVLLFQAPAWRSRNQEYESVVCSECEAGAAP